MAFDSPVQNGYTGYSYFIPVNETMSEAQTGVAAVDRALLILSAFREDDAPVSLALLARRTSLYKSTILRLLQSLIRAGYVARLPDGNYVVGAEPLRLAKIYQTAAVLNGLDV